MQIADLNTSQRKQLNTKLNKNKLVTDYKIHNDHVSINGDNWYSMSAVDDALKKLQTQENIRNNLPICACGNKLRVVKYEGYYDSFRYLDCDNHHCDYIHNANVDDEKHGAYA